MNCIINRIISASVAIAAAALSAVSAGAVPQVVTYSYDAAGRMSTVRYDEAWTIAYVYDANGNITSLTSSGGETGGQEGDVSSLLPRTYQLGQNRPNPFSGRTEMRYQLPRPGGVRLEGFDATGRLVRTLVDATQAAGYYSIVWDGTDDRGNPAPSGIYLLRLTAGEKVVKRRVTLLR